MTWELYLYIYIYIRIYIYIHISCLGKYYNIYIYIYLVRFWIKPPHDLTKPQRVRHSSAPAGVLFAWTGTPFYLRFYRCCHLIDHRYLAFSHFLHLDLGLSHFAIWLYRLALDTLQFGILVFTCLVQYLQFTISFGHCCLWTFGTILFIDFDIGFSLNLKQTALVGPGLSSLQ